MNVARLLRFRSRTVETPTLCPTCTPFRSVGGDRVLLSPREVDVLLLICEGMSNAEIAERLGLSTRTVKNYSCTIAQKFEARNRAQLAAHVLRTGQIADGQRHSAVG